MKRVLDLTISVTGLILALPFLIIISFFIYLDIGKPIFFKQNRIGYKGRVFTIYKFRTMRSQQGYPEGHDEVHRLTRFTSFLRSSSLDEIPTLFNVLKGDMSLVGPRPLLDSYRNEYTEEQFRRHEVMPGVTGWAQVNGRNNITWEEKFKLDLWYVDHKSFFIDLKILIITLKKILKREGVNQSEFHTMERFRKIKDE